MFDTTNRNLSLVDLKSELKLIDPIISQQAEFSTYIHLSVSYQGFVTSTLLFRGMLLINLEIREQLSNRTNLNKCDLILKLIVRKPYGTRYVEP